MLEGPLVVYLNGNRAGTMHIWRSGSGYFSGSPHLPGCWAGSGIPIRATSGALVALGTFHQGGWMM